MSQGEIAANRLKLGVFCGDERRFPQIPGAMSISGSQRNPAKHFPGLIWGG
jgi:hypothetical protein